MVNKVILIGNLGKDPEVKNFENNSKASFSLATNEVYRDRQTGERKTITEWHNIVVWGKQAEIAQKYLHKGSKVYIEGKIGSRKYQDKDGVDRFITEIKVDNFQMLDPIGESTSQGNKLPSEPEYNTPDDDLPF